MQAIYKQLVDLYGEKCYICGRNDVPLEIDYLIPKAIGGPFNIQNLRLICQDDNAKKGNKYIREVELVNYLSDLLSKNMHYRHVQNEFIFPDSKYKADIVFQRRRGADWENVLIEVRVFPTFTNRTLLEVVTQLKLYKKFSKKHTVAFAFPGILPESDNHLIESQGIEVWDINYISSHFSNEILSTPHPLLQAIFTTFKYSPARDNLINELKAIPSGKKNNAWLKYQNHIEKILDYLFGSVLSSPISEHADYFKINRRDFILRNYADTGFWANIRERYLADFIVIDAKNYSKKITKKEVLQIANYLKEHGAGLFGLIISRNGGDLGCYYTCREIWAMDKKLIIVLNDDDVIKMIISKASSDNPEEIIRQKIEHFRLSM
jgi:hypothetical protein